MLSRQVLRSAHTAAARAAPASKGEELTKLPSGLTVASVDNNGPLSQLVLAFRAGSRYENNKQGGLVHHVRNAVGTDAVQYPGVSLVWSSAVAGGSITSFATRDVFGVCLSVPRDETSVALSILGHVAAQPAFKPWEVEEILPTLKADNAYKQAYDVLFEDIHRAAYRNGSLSHSVYASKRQIGKFSHNELLQFAEKHLVSGQGVLYGNNIEHSRLVSYGDNHAPITKGGSVSPDASPYKGGEWRRESGGNVAHILLAGQGASANDAKALAAQAVLLTLLGRSSSVQFSGSTGGLVSKAVKGSGSASAFQAAHQDSGIAGVYIVADASKAGEAVRSAANAIKSLNASDIEGAKRRAANDLLRASAHSQTSAVERAAAILAGQQEGAVLAAISQVTSSDVESAAKKLSSKFSIASYGSINEVPYVDTL